MGRRKTKKSNSRRAHGDGAVYQLEDGTWRAARELPRGAGGKRRRRVYSGATQQEVLEKIRADTGAVTSSETVGLTVADYMTRWLAARKAEVEVSTHAGYRRDSRKICQIIGHVFLTRLDRAAVKRFYDDMLVEGVSSAMRQKTAVTLTTALNYAVDELGLLPHNPALRVKKPTHRPREAAVLTEDQSGRFLAAARHDRLYAFWAVFLDSSAREGELLGLSWDNVLWDRLAIQIVRSLDEVGGHRLKTTKTAKSRRTVALSSYAMTALREHCTAMQAEGNYQEDGPVFCGLRGGWLWKGNLRQRSFHPILERAGLPRIRPYDLRHTGATLLLAAGVDTRIVSERLGHSTTRVTQDIYQHVLPGMQDEAAGSIGSILSRAEKKAARKAL